MTTTKPINSQIEEERVKEQYLLFKDNGIKDIISKCNKEINKINRVSKTSDNDYKKFATNRKKLLRGVIEYANDIEPSKRSEFEKGYNKAQSQFLEMLDNLIKENRKGRSWEKLSEEEQGIEFGFEKVLSQLTKGDEK